MSVRPRLPLVTLLLIAANITAAFSLLLNPDLADELGFVSSRPSFLTAFTGLFLHANVLHLLGNMVFLAAVGAAVELATGATRFIVVYFVGGLCGVGVHYMATRHTPFPEPLIGASACVASCIAYYSVRYTRLRVPIAPKLALPVLGVTVVWLALQIIGAFVHLGDNGGTSYWAHLGGFIGGALLSLVFRAPDLEQVKLGHEVLARMNERGPAATLFAAERHLEQHPKDTKALWEKVEAQESLGEAEAESKTLLQLIELGDDEVRTEALRRLCAIGRVSAVPPLKRLQYADRCPPDAVAVSRALLRSVVEGPRDDVNRPDAIVSLASIEREDNPARFAELISDLVALYPLHPATDLARKRGWVS